MGRKGLVAAILRPAAMAGAVSGTIVVLVVSGWGTSAAARSAVPRASVATTPVVVVRNGLDNRQPFFSTNGGILSWEVNSRRYPNVYNLEVEDQAGHTAFINTPGTDGYSGGMDGATIVYSEWDGTNQHLKLFDLNTGQRTDIPALDTAAFDYLPTISGPWLLFTRSNRSRTSSEILLYNRMTGELRMLASIGANRSGASVYASQVAGNYAVWGRVAKPGQDVFRYQINTRKTLLLRRPRGLFARYNPAVAAGGTVYWEQSGNGCRTKVQIVSETRGGRMRVTATASSGGADAGRMYAFTGRTGVGLVYSRFTYRGCERAKRFGPGAIYFLKG